MNKNIKKHVEDLGSTDDKIRLNALQALLTMTKTRVDWVYEVWDHLLEKLEDENSYQRSIGIIMLCNLAKSDTEVRLKSALDRLLVHTRDEKFITSRQCLQNIWKAAATNKANREKILKHLEQRFVECGDEKHYNLLRQDIIQSMVSLDQYEGGNGLLTRAETLIAKEPDEKHRKKYEALLKAK
ncbi:MAG TPA: hypothetical protein VK897_03830 [Anaerolineales bacterium]|nr:hypothetical protein [Anaerolineales bacterium]